MQPDTQQNQPQQTGIGSAASAPMAPRPPQPTGPQPASGQALPTPTTRNPNSTQSSLLIAELRDGMAVMNDGSFRAIVTCKSINFDLMSSREREGVEYSYQSFLNSLYFPVQIFIRSQRVDLGPYLDRLIKVRQAQDNMLLGVLMDDYIDFMSALSEQANIMDKSFFVVVPYYPAGDMGSAVNTSKNFFASLFATQQKGSVRIDQNTYEKAKDEIKNRVDVVTSGLFQIGIRSVQLSTKELGELYYNVYNPDTAVREPIGNFEELTSTFVQKGQGEASRPYVDREEMS
ncbi:hypothetical protein TM7_0071 [candidate division TM7 genomosp. GTL1]|nr:hypothetical protein TM7_0069 [candidate division TM7 genomosp. GTL1]EDK72771.1 hypothetical protein TM7_0071 [candidate division TM7 genomosp. GTL1]